MIASSANFTRWFTEFVTISVGPIHRFTFNVIKDQLIIISNRPIDKVKIEITSLTSLNFQETRFGYTDSIILKLMKEGNGC